MRYFKDSEFKKDPDKVALFLKKAMDDLRHLSKVPIHIHVAWSDSGHSKKSYHYKGMAVDFHFGGSLSMLEQFAFIRALPELKGIGFYPWWHSPGWHVDLRGTNLFWVSPEPGKYIYSVEDLMKELTR